MERVGSGRPGGDYADPTLEPCHDPGNRRMGDNPNRNPRDFRNRKTLEVSRKSYYRGLASLAP